MNISIKKQIPEITQEDKSVEEYRRQALETLFRRLHPGHSTIKNQNSTKSTVENRDPLKYEEMIKKIIREGKNPFINYTKSAIQQLKPLKKNDIININTLCKYTKSDKLITTLFEMSTYVDNRASNSVDTIDPNILQYIQDNLQFFKSFLDSDRQSIIHYAAYHGKVDIFKALASFGFPLDGHVLLSDEQGIVTPLFLALYKRRIDIIKEIFKLCPEVDIYTPFDVIGNSITRYIVDTLDEDLIRTLLEKSDVDLNILDIYGRGIIYNRVSDIDESNLRKMHNILHKYLFPRGLLIDDYTINQAIYNPSYLEKDIVSLFQHYLEYSYYSDINNPRELDIPAFHVAISKSKYDTISGLISKIRSDTIHYKYQYQEADISRETLTQLLKFNQDKITAIYDMRTEPTMSVLKFTPLQIAAIHGDTRMIELLQQLYSSVKTYDCIDAIDDSDPGLHYTKILTAIQDINNKILV